MADQFIKKAVLVIQGNELLVYHANRVINDSWRMDENQSQLHRT